MIQIKAIVPKALSFQPDRMKAAADRAMTKTAIALQIDFENTTATWNHRVSFTISAPSWKERTIETDDPIYGYVNNGTPPHLIAPRRGKYLRFASKYRSKTLPSSLASRAGGPSGPTVFLRGIVQHPGTKPRNFAAKLAKRYATKLAANIRAEFRAELAGG